MAVSHVSCPRNYQLRGISRLTVTDSVRADFFTAHVYTLHDTGGYEGVMLAVAYVH